MRSLLLLPLIPFLLLACSQNPHLEVADPAAKAQPASVPQDASTAAPGDKDGDGLPNDKDSCPDIAGPESNRGCPYTTVSDSDQDGVPNDSDNCPRVKGPEDNNGCPYDPVFDSDQDGTLNTDDRCPLQKGPPENNGCAYENDGDQDRDGIFDNEDACPAQPGPRDNLGCPYSDRDGDGIQDQKDHCPSVKGPATNGGCPLKNDRDGDGVPNLRDRCPDEPGELEFDGCKSGKSRRPHLPKEEERRVLVAVMESLKFDFDQAVIKDSSYPALQKLQAFMQKYPRARLKIVGHTDEVGTNGYNQNLSQERVDAVKDYLTREGIAENRIHAEARGETEPLVSTEGLEGDELEEAQAQNRRVDMSVRYLTTK